MQPIYEQIISQIKIMVLDGNLKEETLLPSVRSLARELQISALTVKKAYDALEQDGFVVTVHGKGSYIAHTSCELQLEERKKEIEQELEAVIQKAKCYSIQDNEIRELFEIIMEDNQT